MFWVKIMLNDCFFSKILLSYSRIFFRVHSISLFGLLSCWSVPIIQRLLIFTPISHRNIAISAHTFCILSLHSTNQYVWNMYRKKLIGGLILPSI